MVGALGELWRRGGRIAVGTDAGIGPTKPHDILPSAAVDLADAGLTPLEILTTLTVSGAEVCRLGQTKGRLRAGYDADVIAVRGDPLADPAALRDVHTVWRAGLEVR